MTTASINTAVAHSSDATFRTWVAEVIAQLLAVGLTQTADTGQIDTATATRPGTNTSGGYAIFRFNDTAHSTTPIFFKLEFGTASSAAVPQMWITVGQASNGSGTISSTAVMTRVAVGSGSAISSTVNPYISRFCYNATQGVLWMAWKIGGAGAATPSLGGFAICRSTDSVGAVTTDAFMLVTNSNTATGASSNAGYAQVISNLTGVSYTTTPFPTVGWLFSAPLGLTATLYAGNAQCFPVFQYTPILGISASMAAAVQAEIGMNSTVVLALVGSTTHTFIQVGGFHGGTSIGSPSIATSTLGALMLWE